jgi:HJR/Mrr/RecB family endonuclease
LTRDDLFGLFGLEPPASADAFQVQKRTGVELEERCAAILESRGRHVQRTPRTRDGGIDLIGTRTDEVGLEQRVFVQCKDHARPVGVEVVRELLGVLPTDGGTRAVIAAPSGLTADAPKLARDRGVTVWDEATLVRLEG